MVTAGSFKKGMVITLGGAHWVVEDYHVQKTAQRRPVLQTKLRNLRSGHLAERAFDESEKFETPEVASRHFRFLYEDGEGYVFMDSETFDQFTVPAAVVGHGKWLLKEGEDFLIRLVDGHPVQVAFPPSFVDKVVETAEPATGGHTGNVLKDARLACGLVIKVPQFIKAGDHLKVDTETHKYHGKESARH